MAKENFENSVQYVLNDEGGYAERENEPGGACNKGISFLLFKEVWEKDLDFRLTFYNQLEDTKPTFFYLKELTDEAAKYIYLKYVFGRINFDELPVGLDYVMVNTATMQGPTGAMKLLQKALGVVDSGKFDEETKVKLEKTPVIQAIAGVLLYQCQAKMFDPRVGPWEDKNGKKWHGFGPGWSNRIIRVWNRAIEMLKNINNV